jgi:hypothetical protein
MADDFIGVPYPVWSDLEARSRFAGWLAFTAFCLVLLLMAAMVRKDVFAWHDLIDFSEPPA